MFLNESCKNGLKRRYINCMVLLIIVACMFFGITSEAAAPVKRPVRVTEIKAAVTGYDTIKVSWKKQNATGYKIYRSTKKDSGYKLVKTVSATSWKNSGLVPGKKYYYKVKAYNKDGKKSKTSLKYSNIVSATPKMGKPSGLQVSVTGNRGLKISWKAGKYVSGYQIYRAMSKNGKYSKIATTQSTTYTNSNLKENTTYYYKVRAYNKKKDKYYYSSYCQVASGKPVLPKPTNVKAKTNGGSIVVQWNSVSGAKKYYVHRSDGKVFTTTKCSYTDNNIKENVNYRYRVRAYRLAYSKYSAYTSYVKITPVVIKKTIQDAVLYVATNSNKIGYNTLYEAKISSRVKVSGYNITSVQKLKNTMGTLDSPKTVLGTKVEGRTLGRVVTADLALDSQNEIVRITVKRIADRPVVGISWQKDTIESNYTRYAKIFERNGAYVVYLPQITSLEEAEKVLTNVNGVFLTGGEGWIPKFYNEVQTPHGSNEWNETRDISDLCLLKQAISMDVPLLAVCRNAQGLNVAMGGGIIQDVPYYLGQKVLNGEISADRVTEVYSGKLDSIGANVKDTGYRMYDDELGKLVYTYNKSTGEYIEKSGCEEGHLRVVIDGIVHQSSGLYHRLEKGENNEFAINKNSKWLYDIMKSETVSQVVSSHHQAINPERLGEGLTIVAMSSDGIVEAIEYQDNLFALALQWHPEKYLLRNKEGIDQELCNAPMAALVKYARIHNEK